MSADAITIKPNNHRVLPCPNEKKIELVNQLISQNSSTDIVVVTSVDTQGIKEALENKDVVVMNDKEFIMSKELTCEILISFDVPDKAIIYSARVAKATEKAFLLLDKNEQKKLYPIEMLLGRAIKQEKVAGFEYPEVIVQEKEYMGRKMTKEQIKEEAKKRYDKDTQPEKPKFDKPKREYKGDDKKGALGHDRPKKEYSKSNDNNWEKKKRDNKFLGKDENGKAIFSGKSGDRNHRHDGTQRDKYDAPKKVGRKINIKALKKTEEKE